MSDSNSVTRILTVGTSLSLQTERGNLCSHALPAKGVIASGAAILAMTGCWAVSERSECGLPIVRGLPALAAPQSLESTPNLAGGP